MNFDLRNLPESQARALLAQMNDRRSPAKRSRSSSPSPRTPGHSPPPPSKNERERDRLRKQGSRAKNRDLGALPAVKDPARRKACEADTQLWLRTYLPHKFSFPFTADQAGIIAAIEHCARYGGDKAIAAPRGDGKTSIVEGVIAKAIATGLLKFPVIVASTRTFADEIVANIKNLFEVGELLAEDYPEICLPIQALEGAPARGNMQTIAGERTHIRWSSRLTVFPTVAGSAASGAVLMGRGLNGAIRGLRYRNLRPDFVLIDDPETRDSATNPQQIAKREKAIDSDIGGLAGPGKKLARVVLCTLQNGYCLAARLTDPAIKSSFAGQRNRQVIAWPEREDFWDEYVAVRKNGMESKTDPTGRAAQAMYLANREEMDRGANLSNPNRFIPDLLADGSPAELSALQHIFNEIADKGLNFVLTEVQNDPPADERPETSGINATLVESRINGWPQGRLPADTIALVAAADVGKYAIHWQVTAWLQRATGLVIDHGVVEVHGLSAADNEATIQAAIHAALLRFRDELLAEPYRDATGQTHTPALILVDSGDETEAVYQFIRDVGGMPWVASKGIGKNFRHGEPTRERIVGNHWYIHHQPVEGLWLYLLDANYWKGFCHERFLTPTFDADKNLRAGSLSLWQPGQKRQHQAFAKHICAEEWRKEWVGEKGWEVKWVKTSKNNHWLDTAYMCCVAGDMLGVKLLSDQVRVRQATETPAVPGERFTNADGRPFLLTER